jgi:hypothetical protein
MEAAQPSDGTGDQAKLAFCVALISCPYQPIAKP